MTRMQMLHDAMMVLDQRWVFAKGRKGWQAMDPSFANEQVTKREIAVWIALQELDGKNKKLISRLRESNNRAVLPPNSHL